MAMTALYSSPGKTTRLIREAVAPISISLLKDPIHLST